MKKVYLTLGLEEAAAMTTESALVPDIDETYTALPYEGERLVIRTTKPSAGAKKSQNLNHSCQGMAILEKQILVRCTSGGQNCRVYGWGQFSQTWELASTFNLTFPGAAHSNTLQFAPYKAEGKTYPYLYVADLGRVCTVLDMDDINNPSIVQNITLDDSSIPDGNMHIGDDGYIWYCTLDTAHGNHYRFIKFRTVSVSEGRNVTLTSADILEDWETTESYPYAQYIWQGSKVKQGKIFFFFGGTNKHRGFVVYDCNTHKLLADVDISPIMNEEVEDGDFDDNGIRIATINASTYYLRF